MDPVYSRNPLFRFGVFELSLKTGELRKAGIRLGLSPQPFKVLALLASRPGQLVTREEIRQRLWGDETFVDFEQGLNFAISKIRLALSDDAGTPRYIETLPRRGYRFIGSVTGETDGALETQPPADATSAAHRIARLGPRRILPDRGLSLGPKLVRAGILAVPVLALGLGWYAWRHAGQQPEPTRQQVQVTANPINDPIFRAAISPDGKYLAYGDLAGIHLREIESGETYSFPTPERFCFR